MIYTEIQGSRLSLVPFIKTRIYHKTPNKNCKNIFNRKELKVQNPSFSLANRFQSRYKTHPLIRQIIPEKKINILSSKSQIKKKNYRLTLPLQFVKIFLTSSSYICPRFSSSSCELLGESSSFDFLECVSLAKNRFCGSLFLWNMKLAIVAVSFVIDSSFFVQFLVILFVG